MGRTLGVVVAGGRGSRLGLGVPKALAPLAGGTLLDRAVACLAPLCEDVVVAAPADVPLGPHEARRATDPPGAAGPLAGMVAGLGARAHEVAWVLGVDFPLVRRATLVALLARLAERDAAVAMPTPGGVPQPLVCALGARAAPALADALALGERSASRALMALDPVLLDAAALESLGVAPEEFLNVNTPADLAAAERALALRAARVR